VEKIFPSKVAQLNQALLIALDLPGQDDEIFLDVDY
jgi:hypothetical protein